MDNGWIKLHRSLLEWEWYQDHNVVAVFLHCLLRANHRDKKWQGTIIKKGSFITSYKNMSRELSGKNGGLSVQQVRTALSKLKLTGEITIKTSNKYTVISINSWEEYQDDNTQDNKQITNKQQTNNKQITTNKNDKNDKNIYAGKILTSKNSLRACSEEEIKHIARLKNIDIDEVREIHDDMMLKIKDGIFQKKKYGTTTYYTLMNWVGRSSKRKKDVIKKAKQETFEGVEIV